MVNTGSAQFKDQYFGEIDVLGWLPGNAYDEQALLHQRIGLLRGAAVGYGLNGKWSITAGYRRIEIDYFRDNQSGTRKRKATGQEYTLGVRWTPNFRGRFYLTYGADLFLATSERQYETLNAILMPPRFSASDFERRYVGVGLSLRAQYSISARLHAFVVASRWRSGTERDVSRDPNAIFPVNTVTSHTLHLLQGVGVRYYFSLRKEQE